jgi:ATP-dependent 26S proteasome regulatory subunit
MRIASRIHVRQLPAVRPAARSVAALCAVSAVVCLLLAYRGAVAHLEGYTAAWVGATVWTAGAAAAGLLGISWAILSLLSSREPAWVVFGALGLYFEALFVLRFPLAIRSDDLAAALALASPYAAVACWSVASWALRASGMGPRHREARQAGYAALLLSGLWVASVRTGMLHRVYQTGDVLLVVFVPVALACVGASAVALSARRHPAGHVAVQRTAPAPAAPRLTREPRPAVISTLRLSDIVLPERTRLEIQALIRLLRDPGSGAALGIEPPQGAILYGPPGTGKTMIARAIAGETGRAALAFSGAELVSVWIGEGAQLVRAVFDQARRAAPCILFIDELDGVAPARSAADAVGGSASQDARARMAELLGALEGASGPLAGVFVVGASNRLDDIDPAVRSRLAYHVAVPLPDEPARAEILRRIFPARADAAPEEIARVTQGASGRDLRELCRVAGLAALAEDAPSVTRAHFELALRRIHPESGGHATRAASPSRIAQARFSDLVLPQAITAELRTLVRLITAPELGRELGVAPPAGAILHGPPGTGKTLIARAVAGESGRPVMAFAGAALTSMWIGEGTQLVRDMFQQARSQAPCVLFVDELDGITPSRRAEPGAMLAGAGPDATQRINQFLQELEGVGGAAAGVFVIGATNHLDAVDPAVRSRLSYHVAIPLPESAERAEILRRHFPARTTSAPEEVAAIAGGCSGRDLRELCRIAGVIALSEEAQHVTIEHFRRALARLDPEEA